MCSTVPLAVLPLGSSRHSPDCGFSSDPLACWTHFCPPTPLQSQSSTLVPAAVLSPSMSRQRPSVDSESSELWVQCWSTALDWQPHRSTAAPSIPLSSPITSTHWPPAAVIVPAGAVPPADAPEYPAAVMLAWTALSVASLG